MSTASEQHTQIVTIPLLHDPDLEPGTPKRPDIGLPIVYWGQVVEHPHKMTLYLNFENADSDASRSHQLQTAIDTALEDATFDACLSPSPVDLLSSSPVVETAVFHLKEKVSTDTWWEQQHAVEKLLDKAEGCKGHSSGFVKESESTFVALVGWDSVDAHQQWAEKEKEKKHSPLHRYGDLTKHIECVHVDMRGNW